MPVRHDHVRWGEDEQRLCVTLAATGVGSVRTAPLLNTKFHRSRPVRTPQSVSLWRTKHDVRVVRRGKLAPPIITPDVMVEQEFERKSTPDGLTLTSFGSHIKTIDDLIRHAGLDLAKFELDRPEASMHETTVRDTRTGKIRKVQNFRLVARMRATSGPGVVEAVEAVIRAARLPAVPLAATRRSPAPTGTDVLQALIIADPHIAKYAWGRETGHGDYDLAIATRLLRQGITDLLRDGDARRVARRGLYLLGDYFHYDTPQGQTTGGTALDRDGRIEKMLEAGASVLFDAIAASAETTPTDVLLVPGNHDIVMTTALRQILRARFRDGPRITIDRGGATRRYVRHGKCLLGFTHGDKAKPRLAELMAVEAPDDWGRTLYREIHHGHGHQEELVTTVGGVCIRQHRAICPPDGWHAVEGFVGGARGMQSYYYSAARGLVGMTVSDPTAG